MRSKIKILFLAADPLDAGYRPRLGAEFREISQKIQLGSRRDLFQLESGWAIRPGDIQQMLLLHEPHILHFSGHGNKRDGIMLEDDSGNMKPVGKKVLGNLLDILKDNLRVVVLNACFTEYQLDAFTATIDYTIGMNKAIGDKAAIVFAAYFYQALAYDRSVESAFKLAKLQLDLEGITGSKTPQLHVRPDVDASLPFFAR